MDGPETSPPVNGTSGNTSVMEMRGLKHFSNVRAIGDVDFAICRDEVRVIGRRTRRWPHVDNVAIRPLASRHSLDRFTER